MNEFQCPKCHQSGKALAVEMGHRCPEAKCKFIVFVKKEKIDA